MTIRRSLVVLLTTALAVTAAACSDDDPGDAGSSTTADAPTTTAAETTTTIGDEEYSAKLAEAEASLAAAGDDLCGIIDTAGSLPIPATPAQVERSMPMFRAAYEGLARVLEGEHPEHAEALRSTMQAIVEAAEESGWNPESLTSGELQSAPEFQAAWAELQSRYTSQCTETSVPATGAPGGDAEAPGGGSQDAPATTVPAG